MTRAGMPALGVCLLFAMLGAAPIAPSYQGVEEKVDQILAGWKAKPERNSPGWQAFFEAMRGELAAYAAAKTDDDQLRSLDRLYRMSVALGGIAWRPATEVREALRDWLRPRVRVAWAERRLIEAIRGMRPASSSATLANRNRWVQFVDDDLGPALRQYEAAQSVPDRNAALERIHRAIHNLNTGNKAHAWVPSQSLETAVDDLFNHANVNVTVDVATLSPFFNTNVVNNGPVYFKGRWSYVTAGPKTGFGLMPSNDSISFYNSQMMTSVTPVTDFQQQMQQDPRGRRVTKLYSFGATTVDNSQLTVLADIRTDGLHLRPAYQHNVDANVVSAPTAGHGMGRAMAALLGFNEAKITQKVHDNALPEMQQGVAEGAMELGQLKMNEAAALRNQVFRQYLVGDNTLIYKNLTVEGLHFSTQPQRAAISGRVRWSSEEMQAGADAPRPRALAVPANGIAADVHLPSLLSNLAVGAMQNEEMAATKNIMIQTHKEPPGVPLSKSVVTTKNVDFATYAKAVEEARAANDPKVTAIRIKKPDQAPEFGVDKTGDLVMLIHDLSIEVPAPPSAARGGGLTGPKANIYKLTSSRAELALAFHVIPGQGTDPVHFSGKVVSFDPGPDARVYAVNEDEAKAEPLTTFTSSIVMRIFGAKLSTQQIEIPLTAANVPGIKLQSVSPLDPTGWLRVVAKREPKPAPAPVPAATASRSEDPQPAAR